MSDFFELNSTTPPAPAGKVNVVWQFDANSRISGYVEQTPAPGSLQSPWTVDHNADTHKLDNLTKLDFTDVTGTKLELWGNTYKVEIQNSEYRTVYPAGAGRMTFGVTTNGTDFIERVSFDSSGNVTANAFYGSGAGLTANSIPINSLVAGNYSSKITSGTYTISVDYANSAAVSSSSYYVEWMNVGNKPGLIIAGAINSYPNTANHWAISSSSERADVWGAAFEIREPNYKGNTAPNDVAHAPRLGFHWQNVVAAQFGLNNIGWFCLWNSPGTGLVPLNCDWVYSSGLSTGMGPNGVNTLHVRFQHPSTMTWRYQIGPWLNADELDFMASSDNFGSSMVSVMELSQNKVAIRQFVYMYNQNLDQTLHIGSQHVQNNFGTLGWTRSDNSMRLWHSQYGTCFIFRSDGIFIGGISTAAGSAGSGKIYRDASGFLKVS